MTDEARRKSRRDGSLLLMSGETLAAPVDNSQPGWDPVFHGETAALRRQRDWQSGGTGNRDRTGARRGLYPDGSPLDIVAVDSGGRRHPEGVAAFLEHPLRPRRIDSALIASTNGEQ